MAKNPGKWLAIKRPLTLECLEDRRLLAFNPTAIEQEYLQRVNRFRADPAGEFNRMFSSASPLIAREASVQNAVDFFKVNGNTLKSELSALSAVPPLAWNEAIKDFTQLHNAKMIAATPPDQFHSNATQRREALIAAGVEFRIVSGERINSEVVFGAAQSPTHLLASYVVDWGVGPGGMQSPRGHREALNNVDFEQTGLTITAFTGGNLGPWVNSQVLANIANPPSMVVGAVFEDKNDSTGYEAGEGLGAVQIKLEGSTGVFTTTSLGAGGFQIAVPAGTYRATATGGGMKHAVVIETLTVGSTNVWSNFVYDPEAIPPDALEPNNTRAAAVTLTGAAQTISGLSIHLAHDVDYFKLNSSGNGAGSFEILFSHAAGNLDLRVLNASGSLIASSTTATNNEAVVVELTRDTTYFVEVRSAGGATNAAYQLKVNPPQAASPVVVNDRGTANNSTRTTTIDVLANDSDPDGDKAALTPELVNGTHAAFQIVDKQVQYTAPAGYAGVHVAQYTVLDDQGLRSGVGRISVFVVDFSAAHPWQNTAKPSDANGDGLTSPSDALLIINDLNGHSSRRLPTAPGANLDLFGFMDSNGDGFVAPVDVLLIINLLNAGSGEGETGGAADVGAGGDAAADEALWQLLAAGAYQQQAEFRRKAR